MARRWRPQSFAEVVGQDHVTITLQRAIERSRIAHAYIFAGPRGVGKTTTARLLAKAVNCANLKNGSDGRPEPCNECPSCEDITTGNALDVIEIDGASNNKVEDVRTLRENIKFAPSSLTKKVYIIDEVHMLSPAAFNALLKTLEEPPEHAMFIFATTEIHKIPATVISRCQRFDFKRIATREIRGQLQRIAEGDRIDLAADALVAIALKAEGALRDALSILDQLVAYQGEERVTGDVVRQALGLIGSEIYFRTTDVAATGEVGAALELADAILGGGYDAREFLRGFQRHVLNLLFLRAGGSADELDVADEDRKSYVKTVEKHSDEDLLRMGEWAAETEDILREALDPAVRLELLLVRMASMDRAVDLGELLGRMGIEHDSFKQPVKHSGESSPDKETHIAETTALTAEGNIGGGGKGQARMKPEKDASPGNGGGEPPPGEPEEGDDDGGPDLPEDPPGGLSAGNAGPSPSAQNGDENDEDNDLDESPEADSGQLSLTDLRAAWLDLCDRVNLEKRTLGTHLEVGAPTSMENGAVEVTFDPANAFEYQQVLRHQDRIRKAFRLQFGLSKKFVVKKGTIPENLRPRKRKTSGEKREERFREALNENPVWKQMVERFDLKLRDDG